MSLALTLKKRAAMLRRLPVLGPALLTSCTPLLFTSHAVGIGIFWDVQRHEIDGASLESYSGLGLVVTTASVFAGWVAAHELTLDPSRSPSGVARLDDMVVIFGDAAHDPSSLAVIPSTTNPILSR